ncbi:MAG: PKD domain-containing protein [Syntrophales bacterium]
MNGRILWIARTLLLGSLVLLFAGCGGGGGATDTGGTEGSAVTATIVAPSESVQIVQGQSVDFQGAAMGGREPLTYRWSFGGANPDSTALNPGPVLFSAAGTYQVTFTVTDADQRQGADSITVTVVSPTSMNTAIVLASNDLGMHCMDREFSTFSILPPFNVVHAQVLMRSGTGTPVLLSDASVTVRYDAVTDAAGSINTTSIGKTNFWEFGGALFGTTLQPGQGLTGLYMPGDDPLRRGPQPMAYEAAAQSFTAFGIPITPLDDARNTNAYPLMRISVAEKSSGTTIGRLDTVVPVASETDCQTCHRTGGIGSTRSGVPWAVDPDLEVQAKKNILLLHDAVQGTSLATSMPVLCARCHYSAALDLAGTGPAGQQIGKPVFSRVMHSFHGDLTLNGVPLFPPNGTVEATCYQCHPGKITQCARGAMKNAGLECRHCHGDMAAVGAKFPLTAGGSIDGANDGQPRRPWKDLPRCQACHTGDAVSYLTGPNLVPDPNWPFRLRQAYRTGDNSASPLLAVNKRFAENADTLYRFSRGHGGINCNGCHGSTHAEWPNAAPGANDNVAATQLQGYAGHVMECTACHAAGTLPATLNGPHGMHNVNDRRWYDGGHEGFYETNPAGCRACHGLNLTGTPLAKAAAARAFTVEGGTVTIAKGALVSCDLCHEMPD